MAARSGFRVLWTATATLDLAAIVDFLADESPAAALTVFGELEEAARRLESFPLRGRIVPELEEQGIVIYRELICRTWKLIYRLERRDVMIEAVIDGRRNLEDLLLQRFLH